MKKMLCIQSVFAFAVLILIISGCAHDTKMPLMPGAKIFDVTDPASWGGDPSLAATPDDPSNDDAAGINAAIEAAVDYLGEKSGDKEPYEFDYEIRSAKFIFQQMIFLPAGTYHLENSIVIPPYEDNQKYIWLYGQGEDQTILQLKSSEKIGLFGSADIPSPIIQYAQYDFGPELKGNTNYQLFGTDFSIHVPSDQPHAIGLSYGAANLGGLRNITIKAEGEGGKIGLALPQNNNGPGWIENVTVEGFATGIEVKDGKGEIFAFQEITVRNQHPGGTAIALTDKQLAIENLRIEQEHPDVIPIHLFNDDSYQEEFGGAPHLILLNADISCSGEATVPAIRIDIGHSYLRNIRTSGYGEEVIKDHGVLRKSDMGEINGEYISVHGRTPEEKHNVAYTLFDAPKRSLNFNPPLTPEIDHEVFMKLNRGDYTLVDANSLKEGKLEVTTAWIIVDPSKTKDDTRLLQEALNSGARYIGLLNTEPFLISATIVVNGTEKNGVELIYGYMSEICVASALSLRENPEVRSDNILFRIESGSAGKLTVKGLRIASTTGASCNDFIVFLNNTSQTLIFEDIRSKDTPRGYRNGKNSYGSEVFLENTEFAYNGAFQDSIMVFKDQKVWARQFNVEGPIRFGPNTLDCMGIDVPRYTTKPKVVNDGGKLCILSQKMGEQNGVYLYTTNGGKTESLGVYFNNCRYNEFPEMPELTNFIVEGEGSEFSMVGQEVTRTVYDKEGLPTKTLPNGNKFGVVRKSGGNKIIEGTSLPTYLTYEGYDPFMDTSFTVYDQYNHFRVAGLIRVNVTEKP